MAKGKKNNPNLKNVETSVKQLQKELIEIRENTDKLTKRAPIFELTTMVVSLYWVINLFSKPLLFINSKELNKAFGSYSMPYQWAIAFCIAIFSILFGLVFHKSSFRKFGLGLQFFLFSALAVGFYLTNPTFNFDEVIYLIFAFQSSWAIREVGVKSG